MRTERQLREAQMSPAVVAWLKSLGYSVYAEISGVDHVGVRWSDNSIICVEMKCSLTKKVIYQATLNQLVTKDSYVAVPRQPRAASIEELKRRGLGLWVNGEVVVEPVDKRHSRFGSRYVARMLDLCSRAVEGGVGGLPTLLGDGPAIRCAAAVKAYREANPKAKWKDIWLNVPNHYQHYRSMQGALRRVEEIAQHRARKESQCQ